MPKKPKPATAGRKIAADVYPDGTIDHAICRLRLSIRIDRAIAHAERKGRRGERIRCLGWLRCYRDSNTMNLDELFCALEGDEHP